MKITLSQINPRTNKFDYNATLIKEAFEKTDNDTLLLFPELSLSGSPLYGLTAYDEVFNNSAKQIKELCTAKRDFMVGLPLIREGKKYNAIAFVEKGELKALSTKRNLGNLDNGFAEGQGVKQIQYKGKTIAFGFLADLEDFVGSSAKADLIICLSNEVFEVGKQEKILQYLQTTAAKLACPLVFLNRCGAEGRYIFNGGSFVVLPSGEIAEEYPLFEAETRTITTENLHAVPQRHTSKPEQLYGAALTGIRDYFEKNNIGKAVIGLSGGIDSALVAVLAVHALGKDKVIGILMPSEYSTSHSVTDAVASAENLQMKYHIIPIKENFSSILSSVQPVFADLPFGLAEENLQSRIRCCILMAVANKIGAALLNTSNKSEAAVGYGTLYGDMSGGIGAIGDMYKTEVWELSRWINRKGEVIPENSITKAPSAELRPEQKDSDSLPEYDVLDKILYQHLEQQKDREEIISQGFDTAVVDKILRLVRINEWKRRQAAPSLKMSSCTFGIDRSVPVS